MTELTQDQKRLKIAAACGWTFTDVSNIPPGTSGKWSKEKSEMEGIPDYFNSQDACWEMEESLNPQRVPRSGRYDDRSEKWGRYYLTLLRLCEQKNVSVAHCPESVRCEAFGEAFELWKN